MSETLFGTPAPVKPPRNLSPSALSTWNTCPLQYKFSKIDKLPQPKSVEQVRGIFVHKILEEIFQLDSDERTINMAKTVARALADGEFAEDIHDLFEHDDDAKREFRWQAWWAVENYFSLEDPTSVVPEGTEEWVKGNLGNAFMIGVIDRWSVDDEGLATVTDYKTGKAPRPQYASEKITQIAIYALMLKKLKKVDVRYGELLYLKNEGGERNKYEMTPELLKETTVEVARVWKEIKEACATGIFEPTPSKLCDWCSFKPICPAFN